MNTKPKVSINEVLNIDLTYYFKFRVQIWRHVFLVLELKSRGQGWFDSEVLKEGQYGKISGIIYSLRLSKVR